MTTAEIAEFLELPKTVFVCTLQKHNIFMQGQRKYKPNVTWCKTCDAASYEKSLKNGICFHCLTEEREMAKIERGDCRGRPKKDKTAESTTKPEQQQKK